MVNGTLRDWGATLVNNNIEEGYNQEKDLSENFYYNLNKMEIPDIENIEDN